MLFQRGSVSNTTVVLFLLVRLHFSSLDVLIIFLQRCSAITPELCAATTLIRNCRRMMSFYILLKGILLSESLFFISFTLHVFFKANRAEREVKQTEVC